ncbi:MAG: CADD family putative folate metabolism protein [Chlorobi bacterium]|nr:CADD family putative folate metabolism protein [Chlorobiota bacterium]MCI0717110.1 CADD family putative folate metabolism protein [Chlorobiota bacterium]
MLTKEEFINELEKILEEKSILKHPFYQKWNEGKLTIKELQEYSKQYYHFVKHFPMFVSSVHSNCTDAETRRMLVENIADEDGYKTGTTDHPSLWLNFAKALGISSEQAENAEVVNEVKKSINGFYELCRSNNYKTGLAALYGYESQIPEVSRVKIQGLKKFYGIESPDAIEFFAVHREADIRHSKTELDAILKNCKTEDEQKNTLNSVKKSAELYWQMLDGVYVN